MSSNDGKLLATAVGAATAGAALAIMALKMIEGNNNNNNNNNNGGIGSSSNNNHNYPGHNQSVLAYHLDPRPKRPTVIMNDPSDLHESISHGSMQREPSEATLFPHNHEEKMRRRIATRYTIEEENNLGRDSVTVRVPATSANVGPGCELWCSTVPYRSTVFVLCFALI